LIEQTSGETLFNGASPEHPLPATLVLDSDIRRKRFDLLQPMVEEFQLVGIGDKEIEFEGAVPPRDLALALPVLYSCLYPILLGVQHRTVVDFYLAEAQRAAGIIADHAKGSDTKALTTAVTSLLSAYRQESIVGLAFSAGGQDGDREETLQILASEDYRHLARRTFQLGLPDAAAQVSPELAAMAERLAANLDGVELIASPILVPSSTESRDRKAFEEIFGSLYLPPVVETATLGPGRRELAELRGAYTALPAYAKREKSNPGWDDKRVDTEQPEPPWIRFRPLDCWN
jgi:hypothetical protein